MPLSTLLRGPFLRTLLPSIGLAYGIQTAFAIPGIIYQTEKYYDLSGSLTYISVAALSLYLPTLRARAAAAASGVATSAVKGGVTSWPGIVEAFSKGYSGSGAGVVNWRSFALTLAVTVWAARLGSYLYKRIGEEKSDSRFDGIRGKPLPFLGAWGAQATWVTLCSLPILLVNSLPATAAIATAGVRPTDILGLGMFIFGLSFEILADREKSAWSKAKREKKHSEEFITTGLWGKSRHPNYFGEITAWSGIAVTAAGVLCGKAGQVGMGLVSYGAAGPLIAAGLCAVSPGFVSFLLLKVSGVPLSENKYDKKFKDNKKYWEWKNNTPMIVPKLF